MNRIAMVLMVACCTLGTGCTARYVARSGDEGIVAVPLDQHRTQALALIRKHVGSDYDIVEEREVIIGQSRRQDVFMERQANRQQSTQTTSTTTISLVSIPAIPGTASTNPDTITTQSEVIRNLPLTEYQIHYKKRVGGVALDTTDRSKLVTQLKIKPDVEIAKIEEKEPAVKAARYDTPALPQKSDFASSPIP